MPLVSILTPTLDASGYLRDCLGSVRDQTFRREEIEHIVLDGESKDTGCRPGGVLAVPLSRLLVGDHEEPTCRRGGRDPRHAERSPHIRCPHGTFQVHPPPAAA
jgi:hypothetical protein